MHNLHVIQKVSACAEESVITMIAWILLCTEIVFLVSQQLVGAMEIFTAEVAQQDQAPEVKSWRLNLYARKQKCVGLDIGPFLAEMGTQKVKINRETWCTPLFCFCASSTLTSFRQYTQNCSLEHIWPMPRRCCPCASSSCAYQVWTGRGSRRGKGHTWTCSEKKMSVDTHQTPATPYLASRGTVLARSISAHTLVGDSVASSTQHVHSTGRRVGVDHNQIVGGRENPIIFRLRCKDSEGLSWNCSGRCGTTTHKLHYSPWRVPERCAQRLNLIGKRGGDEGSIWGCQALQQVQSPVLLQGWEASSCAEE